MRRLLTKLILVSIVSLFAQFNVSTSQAAVWTNTQQWSPEWELKYQEWVLKNWDKDFFKRPGFYQNVLMDCADAVYSMRLVFSALHGLPFAMKDPSGPGVISNDMTRWDNLPEEKRKREFLFYVYLMGSTGSLPEDTFPVATNRAAVTPGTIILTDHRSHHSWTIKFVSDFGIPFLLYSSRPARTELYERFEFPSVEFTFPNGLNPARHAGIRAFRQPDQIGKPVWQVPGYSLEQYQIPIDHWLIQMQRRLATRNESAEARASRILAEACKGAQERVEVVRLGVEANSKIGSRCMNAQEYDDFSTPNRDKRMKDTFVSLEAAYREALRSGAMTTAGLQARLQSVMAGETSAANPDAYCPVEIAPGVKLTLGQIYARSVGDKLSNNPHDTLEMRWGLQAFPSSKASSCPVY